MPSPVRELCAEITALLETNTPSFDEYAPGGTLVYEVFAKTLMDAALDLLRSVSETKVVYLRQLVLFGLEQCWLDKGEGERLAATISRYYATNYI